uniref:Pollen-specific protein SF3 n=1 Tax=Anthurium amnicola TaxID=1678845 RepID=A0A1D1XTR4_9ARAE
MASGGGGVVFGGTTQKCKACEKTVYLVDQLTVDNRVYHRACFRCHHCKGTLKLSNYSSFEGVLYCKPHFDQLLKMTGSLEKSFEGVPRAVKAERSIGNEAYSTSRVSSIFRGTQDKCVTCKKTVYPIEKVAVDDNSYHRTCFRCVHGGCVISPSNYVAHEGRLYCKHHHSQLFMWKGNFSQLAKNETATEPMEKAVPENAEQTENPITINGKESMGNSTSEPTEEATEKAVPENAEQTENPITINGKESMGNSTSEPTEEATENSV